MSDERKGLIVSIFFGVIEIIFSIIATVKYANVLLVINMLLSVGLMVALIVLYLKYRHAIDSYNFIKFLFFGSEYNGFNVFPKLKLYMDYLKMYNPVEVETLEFECVDDNDDKLSYVQWSMKNVYNKTQEDIKSYYLYTANEYGTTDNVIIEVREGNRILNIDTDNIRKRNLIRQTPFTFVEPIKPKGRVPEIKIRMRMQRQFFDSQQKIVYLYPRNYGTKVSHIEIKYKRNRGGQASVILHEIGNGKKGYCDNPIKSCLVKEEDGMWIYSCTLDKHEINVNNLYYLFIKAK